MLDTSTLVRTRNGLYVRLIEEKGKLIGLGPVLKLPIRADSVVLDLGAHIGGFTKVALDKGAATIIAVEAHPSTFEVLQYNFKDEPRVKCIHGAIVADTYDKEYATLYLSTRVNTTLACSSMFPKTSGYVSIQVPIIRIGTLLKDVTVIKCDIEGAEYLLEIWDNLPNSIKAVAIDFHSYASIANWQDAAENIIEALRKQGFSGFNPINFNSGWGSNGAWYRS